MVKSVAYPEVIIELVKLIVQGEKVHVDEVLKCLRLGLVHMDIRYLEDDTVSYPLLTILGEVLDTQDKVLQSQVEKIIEQLFLKLGPERMG